MPAVVFDNDDGPFLQWMKENPNSYVVNTGRGRNSRYFTLHQAKCKTLQRTTVKNPQPNPFTSGNYIKVCADSPSDLLSWATDNRPRRSGFGAICSKCNPDLIRAVALYPEQVMETHSHLKEGAVRTIEINYYERNPEARARCLAHWGLRCQVCSFRFDEKYGELGDGFIHVHHLKSISEIGKEYVVDPVEDLRPVCPNCHAMLHRNHHPMEIEALKRLIQETQNKREGV